MNGLNTMIQELHSNLIKDINSSQLPVGIVFFVLKDIFNETEKGYINAINAEKMPKPQVVVEEDTEKEETNEED